MAGAERRLGQSVQHRLSLWLALAILAAALLGGTFSFVTAYREAHEMQDDLLRQVAALFDAQHLPAPYLADAGRLPHSDEDARVIVQHLTPGRVATGQVLAVPDNLPDGVGTLTVHDESYRVLVRTLETGDRILVAQETGMRDEIARHGALGTVLPFLALVPVLLLIVANLVRKMFRPIAALSHDIDQRSEQALHALPDEHVPSEVRPFVVAINRLLGRVSQSMAVQRRFVADAAHELRSPMTALSLQAERLAQADMSETARTRLITLRQGIERSRSLLEQLLSLARAQSVDAMAAPPGLSVSVQRTFRRVLEDLMPLADARQIDIGVEGHVDVQVPIGEVDLFTLLKNLVDNAIRYTPEGGRVDLAVTAVPDAAVLTVTDTGPGIAPAERHRIFDPFYRIPGNAVLGSGLGLSIVQAIADRAGAGITVGYADEAQCTGTRIAIRFPIAQA